MQKGQVIKEQNQEEKREEEEEEVAAGASRKALVISVSNYSTNLQPLSFCKNDGEEMYDLLKVLGYEILDTRKLIGYVKFDAMREAIYDFFDNANAKADDTLVFYYSGHGIPAPDGDMCLSSSEINPDDPYRRGFSSYELTRLMQGSVSLRVVTILDCCYSGAAKVSKGHEDDAAKIGTAAIQEKARMLQEQQQQGEGKCLLAASQAAQEAYGLKQQEHSIFTYYLLEGLRGNEKSVDVNGNITPYSLGSYIYKAILNLPPKKRPKQKPITKVEASGDIILASYPNLSKSQFDCSAITTQPSHHLEEEMKEEKEKDKNKEEEVHISSSPSTTELNKQQQKIFSKPKIFIPLIAIVIGVVIVVAFVVFFGSGIMHHQPQPPPTTVIKNPPNTMPVSPPPPVAIGKSFITSVNKPVNITLQGHSDQSNVNLVAKKVTNPSHGTLGQIDQSTGIVSYTPNPGYTGVDSFTFKVNDGKMDSNNTGIIRITINGLASANNAHSPSPSLVAIGKSFITSVNKPVNITLQGHSDQSNVNLVAKKVTNPSHGTLGQIDQSTGIVSYTPNPGYTGVDSFTFKVNDGKMDSNNTGIIRITIK